MSWAALLALGAGAYALKVVGLVVLGPRASAGAALRLTALLPAALLPALVAVQTFGDGRSLVLDARVAGVAIGAFAVWRAAPFAVVVVLAAATTALLRAL